MKFIRADPKQEYSLDFLAGVNGTGKTTVLYLLGRIFATLESEDYNLPIPFELVYTLKTAEGQEKEITVSNVVEGDDDAAQQVLSNLRYRIEGDDNWKSEKLRPEYLPRHVVIYTTGSESEWIAQLVDKKDDSGSSVAAAIPKEDEDKVYLEELPGHQLEVPEEDEPGNLNLERRLLFIHPDRLPLVALCGLIASRWYIENGEEEDGKEVLHPVLESIGLDSMLSFSLQVRAHRSLTPVAQQEIIDRLEEAADRIVRQGADRRLVFSVGEQLNKHRDGNPSVFDIYDSPIELFQRLNDLYEHRPHYDPPLQEVSTFLRRRLPHESDEDMSESEPTQPAAMLHLFDWLSDGEQSFLGRMALFCLFRADNLLILLDEPEVHFNDVWKREIVNMLDKIMQNVASHAVVTTHTSITLTDVRPQDILVLRRQGEFTEGDGAVSDPGIETLGADPSDILVHVFGTRSPSGERGIRYIRRQIGERNTLKELEELEHMVAPGYWRYRVQLEAQRLKGPPA
jgi:hypothetical protein